MPNVPVNKFLAWPAQLEEIMTPRHALKSRGWHQQALAVETLEPFGIQRPSPWLLPRLPPIPSTPVPLSTCGPAHPATRRHTRPAAHPGLINPPPHRSLAPHRGRRPDHEGHQWGTSSLHGPGRDATNRQLAEDPGKSSGREIHAHQISPPPLFPIDAA